jgi:hypothetical protein
LSSYPIYPVLVVCLNLCLVCEVQWNLHTRLMWFWGRLEVRRVWDSYVGCPGMAQTTAPGREWPMILPIIDNWMGITRLLPSHRLV